MGSTIKNISLTNGDGEPPIVFGSVVYGPGGTCGPRTQQDVQLVFVERGEASILIDDESFHLPAGHVALLHPGNTEFFQFAVGEETHHSWFSIEPRRVPREFLKQLQTMPFSLVCSARMRSLLQLGFSCPAADPSTIEALLESLGLTLLREFVAEATAVSKQKELPPALLRAQEIIAEKWAEPLGVEELARRSGASPHHLIRLFRTHLGETPARYLWKTRTEHGAQLLAETGLTISEIAARTGFQTPFHFSRLIKQQYGLAPKMLRQRFWNR
ncbi:MAG TPA: AraC family transcriptional regulator [Chthoniobacterales bacterium]|jgi:AraC family transcriptional regulator of arabinose operon